MGNETSASKESKSANPGSVLASAPAKTLNTTVDAKTDRKSDKEREKDAKKVTENGANVAKLPRCKLFCCYS